MIQAKRRQVTARVRAMSTIQLLELPAPVAVLLPVVGEAVAARTSSSSRTRLSHCSSLNARSAGSGNRLPTGGLRNPLAGHLLSESLFLVGRLVGSGKGAHGGADFSGVLVGMSVCGVEITRSWSVCYLFLVAAIDLLVWLYNMDCVLFLPGFSRL